MRISEERKNIFKALADLKKGFKQPLKDANNPYFDSKYVPLESVVQAIDIEAHKHGLSYCQSAVTNEQGLAGVITMIIHSSGEFIEFDPLFLKPNKQTPQGVGSAITYARRYSLSSAFGIASDVDDDGNEASGNGKRRSNSDDKKLKAKQDFLADKFPEFEKHGISKSTFYAGLGQRLGVEEPIQCELSEIIMTTKAWLDQLNEG